MSSPTALAITAGSLKALSQLQSGYSDAANLDAQTNQYRINAALEREAAEQAYAEGAMTVNQATDSANKEIAAGVATMSAAGNIGTSAQSALMQGYFNLGKDVSAINYKYGNKALLHKNQAMMLEYNAKVSESNRKNRILSSWLGAGTSFVGGLFGASNYSGGSGWANTGPAYGLESTVGVGGVPMYGGSL